MDFLTTLYSNDNFGIILFITISILVLAFLVILFFGKKDQKERELAATKSVELNNNSAGQFAFQENQPQTMMDIPLPPNPSPTPSVQPPMKPNNINSVPTPPPVSQMNIPPVSEPPKYTPRGPEISQNIQPNPVPPISKEPQEQNYMNYREPNPNIPPIYQPTAKTPERVVEPPQTPQPPKEPEIKTPPKTDFDFDALAASISKELKSLETMNSHRETKPKIENTPNLDETIRIPTFEPSTTSSNRGPVPPIQKEMDRTSDRNTRPINPIPPRPQLQPEPRPMSSPTQFSSVFVSKKQEAQEPKVQVAPSIEISQKEEPLPSRPTPVKPNIELPKAIDLPKLNGNNNTPEPSLPKSQPKIVFPSLENDIPTYNRNNENRM